MTIVKIWLVPIIIIVIMILIMKVFKLTIIMNSRVMTVIL